MRKIKLALLGSGICANSFHWPALETLTDYFEPIIIAGRNEAQNAAYAQRTGIHRTVTDYREAICDPEVEAVIACYPYFLNEDLVRCAKEAGKHILIEKPIAQDIATAARLRTLDDGTVVMGVAENWLFFDSVQVIRKLLEKGSIGVPMAAGIYSLYEMPLESEYLAGDAWRKKAQGGMVLDRAIHSIAFSRAVLGPVKTVTGNSCVIRSALGSQDTMFAQVQYDSGVIGNIHVCASAPGVKLPFSYAIYGTEGMLRVSGFMDCIEVTGAHPGVYHTDRRDGGYAAEFRAFYDSIVNGTPFAGNFAGAYNDLFTATAALETPGVWRTID